MFNHLFENSKVAALAKLRLLANKKGVMVAFTTGGSNSQWCMLNFETLKNSTTNEGKGNNPMFCQSCENAIRFFILRAYALLKMWSRPLALSSVQISSPKLHNSEQ